MITRVMASTYRIDLRTVNIVPCNSVASEGTYNTTSARHSEFVELQPHPQAKVLSFECAKNSGILFSTPFQSSAKHSCRPGSSNMSVSSSSERSQYPMRRLLRPDQVLFGRERGVADEGPCGRNEPPLRAPTRRGQSMSVGDTASSELQVSTTLKRSTTLDDCSR